MDQSASLEKVLADDASAAVNFECFQQRLAEYRQKQQATERQEALSSAERKRFDAWYGKQVKT
jgi:hypothetical protein